MKTFITFSPQQDVLRSFRYQTTGNDRLAYGETRFPIIPAINGYAEPGEEIRVIVLCQKYEWCVHNLSYLQEELETLFREKNLRSAAPDGALFERVDVPYGDAVTDHIESFQALIDHIQDGDDLHACITYGSKPAPMVELMAMRYARQLKQNTYISCVVYGKIVWNKVEATKEAFIYDVTALTHLDDMIRVLAQIGDPNPKAALDLMLQI